MHAWHSHENYKFPGLLKGNRPCLSPVLKLSIEGLFGNAVNHQCTKHIEMDIHFVREKVQKDESLRIGVDARFIVDQQEIATTIQVKQKNPKDGQAEKPTGTVPILRVDANYSSTHFPSLGANPNDDAPDIRLAVVRTKGDPNKKFLGVGGWPSLHKPNVDGRVDQYSAARIKLLNGPDSVEVGWMVNPALFKDKEAHLYVRFKAGETECPGFVKVAKDVEFGLVPGQYSTFGGQRIVWKLFIDKHDDGNWWVSMDDDKYNIGYWPKNLFTALSDFANQVEWGGEVRINPSATGDNFKLPEMEYGKTVVYDTQKSASFQRATLVNEDHQSISPPDTEKFELHKFVYNVLDAGYKGDDLGRLIFYGGSIQSI